VNNPRAHRPAASFATSPDLVAAPETCSGSTSVGASSIVGGVSFGTTWENESCNRRMNARILWGLGHQDAALALLAQDATIRQALLDVNAPVPARLLVPVEPVVAPTAYPPYRETPGGS
jgi:hypothetical protein